MLVLAGVLIAIFFRGIASLIHKKIKLNFNIALVLSVVLILGLLTLTGFYMAPKISEQYKQLKEAVPQGYEKLKSNLRKSETGKLVLEQIQQPLNQSGGGNNIRGKVMTFFSTTFGVLGDIYIIFFLGIFFMAQPQVYKKGIIKLFPPDRRERTAEVLDQTGMTLQRWLLGKIMSMTIVAVLTIVGLNILGVPLAFTLGIIAGLLSFIPNFGPLIALVPAILIALLKEPQLALYVTLLYVGIQAVESNLLMPFIQKSMVKLPMAMVLIAQIALGIVAGGLALILAVPVVAILKVWIDMVYVEDILEKRSST